MWEACPTSPHTPPDTKSDNPSSPSIALATKSDATTSPNIAPWVSLKTAFRSRPPQKKGSGTAEKQCACHKNWHQQIWVFLVVTAWRKKLKVNAWGCDVFCVGVCASSWIVCKGFKVYSSLGSFGHLRHWVNLSSRHQSLFLLKVIKLTFCCMKPTYQGRFLCGVMPAIHSLGRHVLKNLPFLTFFRNDFAWNTIQENADEL